MNIKEAVETIVNLSTNAFSQITDDDDDGDARAALLNIQETEEYWIVLGVYIHALWQQPWIKAIHQRGKELFGLTDNMDYFFNKCRLCMAPDYKVSDQVKQTIYIIHNYI